MTPSRTLVAKAFVAKPFAATALVAGLLVAAPPGGQARESRSPREVAFSLVRLVHLQKVCPPFMAIDQALAATMARNLLVTGYEEFGADKFDALVVAVSSEFTASLMPRQEAEWCSQEREDYRRRNRDGLFR